MKKYEKIVFKLIFFGFLVLLGGQNVFASTFTVTNLSATPSVAMGISVYKVKNYEIFSFATASYLNDSASSIYNNFQPVSLVVAPSAFWQGVALDSSNNNVYAIANNFGSGSDIYKQTGGSGSFVALGQGAQAWSAVSIDSSNHNVYAAAWSGGSGYIYKQTGGSGSFAYLNQTIPGEVLGISVDSSNHNVYATVMNGDIYEQTGGAGNFVALGQTVRKWIGISADSADHDVYAVVSNGDIYEQTGGAGNFVALGQTSRAWTGVSVDSSNETVYLSTFGAGIFQGLYATPDLTAGIVSPNSATVGVATTFSSTIDNIGTGSTGTSFNNFFQVATAANGGGTLTDLASSSMSTLAANATNTATSPNYTFGSGGTYSVRACADKSNRNDTGTITESNENNNCGSWANVTVTAPVMSGTLAPTSSTSCVIAVGASSCPINFTWTTTNPQATSNVTSDTDNNGAGHANFSLNTNSNNGSQNFTIPYNGRNFYLYNSGTLLASSTVSAFSVTCTTPGSLWNGATCAASVNGAPGTASGKTYPNGTNTYNPDTQCSAGTSDNTAFPTAGNSATWHCVGLNGGSIGGPYSASQSAPATTVSISATFSTIFTGNSTTLTWSSNAPSCSGTNFSTGGAPSGSVPVSPTSTVTYTLSCAGVSKQATVTVKPKPGFTEN